MRLVIVTRATAGDGADSPDEGPARDGKGSDRAPRVAVDVALIHDDRSRSDLPSQHPTSGAAPAELKPVPKYEADPERVTHEGFDGPDDDDLDEETLEWFCREAARRVVARGVCSVEMAMSLYGVSSLDPMPGFDSVEFAKPTR